MELNQHVSKKGPWSNTPIYTFTNRLKIQHLALLSLFHRYTFLDNSISRHIPKALFFMTSLKIILL